ncbi:MAG TPA: Hsp20/alpha crystallin family protein [Gemmatimonadales bacterium]
MWMVQTRRPADEVMQLQGRLQRMMSDAFSPWPFDYDTSTVGSAWAPAVDVFEDKEAIKLMGELPGVKPEDVKISLENSTLTLRGEKKQAAEEKTERVHRYERSYGRFERVFTLPSTVDADRIEATFEDGVLTVMLPKTERARPREIPVNHKARQIKPETR